MTPYSLWLCPHSMYSAALWSSLSCDVTSKSSWLIVSNSARLDRFFLAQLLITEGMSPPAAASTNLSRAGCALGVSSPKRQVCCACPPLRREALVDASAPPSRAAARWGVGVEGLATV